MATTTVLVADAVPPVVATEVVDAPTGAVVVVDIGVGEGVDLLAGVGIAVGVGADLPAGVGMGVGC